MNKTISRRQAILLAARSIEQNPNVYDFKRGHVPPCGSPGCLIGLVGYHFGVEVGECNVQTCDKVFGFLNTGIFYDRMTDLHVTDWMDKPSAAVKVLRLYADRYHPAQPESFWQRVNVGPPDECWEWTGYIGQQGYGRLRLEGKYWNAHRLAYTSAYGEIPTGENRADYVVMHSCDNRTCCNPSHLSLGTGRENVMDAVQKGRYKRKEHDPRTRHGSENNAAILNETQVAEIKLLISFGVTQPKMAKHYGVSMPTISAIAVGRNWSQVEPAQGIPDSVLAIFENGFMTKVQAE